MNTLFKLAFIVAALLLSVPLQATTYTTVASGNYSAASVWQGGVKPPATLGVDTIIINAGHDILMDSNLVFKYQRGYLQVKGKLTGTGRYILWLGTNSRLWVSGALELDSIYANNTATFDVPGQLTVQKWCVDRDSRIKGGGIINITKDFISGGLDIEAGSTLQFKDSVNLKFISERGIRLTQAGAVLNLPPTFYHVTYFDTFFAYDVKTGAELNGQGLHDINVEVAVYPQAFPGQVLLEDNLNVHSGKLNLKRGTLILNGKTLSFTGNGDFSAIDGRISSRFGDCAIVISCQSGLTEPLQFRSPAILGEITQNTGNGAATRLNLKGTPVIHKAVNFLNGKIILEDGTLTMDTGSYTTGASQDKYFVTSETGLLKGNGKKIDSVWYHIGTPLVYAPVRVFFDTTSSPIADKSVAAYVQDGVRALGKTGNLMSASQPMVNATWFFDPPRANLQHGFELYWSSSMEVNGFDRNKHVCNYYDHTWKPTAGKTSLIPAPQGMYGLFDNFKDVLSSFNPFYRSIVDENTVLVQNIVTDKFFRTYPNPATTVLHMDINSAAKAVVYNTSGQTVATADVGSGSNTINIANLPQGMYYLQIKGETVNGTAKFVKQ